MTDKSALAIVEGAIKGLEDGGWCQNKNWERGPDGEICAMCMGYAMVRADPALGLSGSFYRAREAVRSCLPGSYGGISQWNDAPERTKEEVLEMLRTAARRLRDQASAV